MTTLSINPYFIFQSFECYAKLIFEELLYNKRSIFFSSISKYFVTITVINISKNIIKQYYGIIKTFKVLAIVKDKQFSRTNILI